MSHRIATLTSNRIKYGWQQMRRARAPYRGLVIVGALTLLYASVGPSLSVAAAPDSLAASKSRAEADAKAFLGTDATAALPSSVPQPGTMPNPESFSSLPTGSISDTQAQDIARKSLNVALDTPSGSTPQLVQSGSVFTIKSTQTTDSPAAQANAETRLRQELALQGYSTKQIDDAVAVLKNMRTAIDQQSVGSSVTLPTNTNGAIGLGAQVTLSLPSSSASDAAPIAPNAVIYRNTSQSSDTAVKVVDAHTIETYQIIRDRNAPEVYTYRLNNLPSGVLLRQVDAQTIEAYFPAQTYGQGTHAVSVPKTVVANIKAPWARDARGTSVPVSLTIGANDTIEMHVDHKNGNYLYPIVADPFAWWGWWGFMWWGSDWEINHYLGASVVAAGLAGAVGWAVTSAVIGVIGGVAMWCEGPNGATFFFNFIPWYPYVQFNHCQSW